jgi:two-component system KDP operon response regulator KdpE
MLRRVQTRDEESGVSFGDVEIDFARRVVTKAGTALKLTPKEYGLLRLLVLHRGKVITHRQILRELWGPKAEEQTQYLRVYMAHLRQKLEDDPNQPKFFRTESGIGYRFSGE